MTIRATGCHHMAFVTNKMDETVDFYTNVLGLPLVVTLQLPPQDPFPGAVWGDLGGAKHYFFDIGNGDRIAFFEFHEELPENYAQMGAGNHLAIAVPSETALLVMDFTKQTCTPERRKRCADQVPNVVKLVNEARAKGALIIYSVAVPNSVPADGVRVAPMILMPCACTRRMISW